MEVNGQQECSNSVCIYEIPRKIVRTSARFYGLVQVISY